MHECCVLLALKLGNATAKCGDSLRESVFFGQKCSLLVVAALTLCIMRCMGKHTLLCAYTHATLGMATAVRRHATRRHADCAEVAEYHRR